MAKPRSLVIVFGPLTRLGRAWLNGPETDVREVVLVARHAGDRQRLSARYPGHKVYSDDDSGLPTPSGRAEVVILGLALGPIHPEVPNWARRVPEIGRDLGLLEKLLDDCGAVPVHFVYVSSVLSLAPRGTAWYGGWKNVVEDAAATLLARSPNARLSVLFPGRLISQRRAELPASALYTKFSSLASRIDRILAQGRPVRRVVGLDARAWLVVRSLSNLGRLVFNRF
jgi:hypothetical protein